MITDLTDPALKVIDNGSSVMVHVRGGTLLVSTATEAYALAAALKLAGWHCEQAAMLRSSRKDRVAAVETNTAFADVNAEFGTLPQAFTGSSAPATTESRVVRIPITACECDHANCTHGGAA